MADITIYFTVNIDYLLMAVSYVNSCTCVIENGFEF